MALRIGCDLDGVLADMESELAHQARMLFGELPPAHHRVAADLTNRPAIAPAQPSVPDLQTLDLNERQQRQLWRHVESIDSFWETLHEIERGMVARLAALTAQRRWEVIFLTRRPESAGPTVQLQSQRWLEAQGFPLPSVFVVHGSRGRVADALNLDFVIDDRPENCLDVVVDSKARALLVWRDDESELPQGARRFGIGVVRTTAAAFDVLVKADAPAKESPGLVERLRKRLGFGSATE